MPDRIAALEAVAQAARDLIDEMMQEGDASDTTQDELIVHLAALDAAPDDEGWIEKVREGLEDIVGAVDGCLDAPRDPTSLPQMVRYEANRLCGLLPPPPHR